MASGLLTQDEIDERLATLHEGWSGTPEALTRSIEFADFPAAVEFVTRIAPRCEELQHHPDLSLRWRWVDLSLTTHSAGGVTDMDVRLAGIIDEVAAGVPKAN